MNPSGSDVGGFHRRQAQSVRRRDRVVERAFGQVAMGARRGAHGPPEADPARIDASEPPFGFGDVQAADLSSWMATQSPEWRRFATPCSRRRAVARRRNLNLSANRRRADSAAVAAAKRGWQTPPPHAGAAWRGQGTPAGDLSPIGYIQKCLRMYVDGKGRARRREFGWFFVFAFVVGVIAAILDIMVGGIDPYTGMARSSLFVLIAALALIAPTVAAASRRAHDFGQTGWLAALAAFLPRLDRRPGFHLSRPTGAESAWARSESGPAFERPPASARRGRAARRGEADVFLSTHARIRRGPSKSPEVFSRRPRGVWDNESRRHDLGRLHRGQAHSCKR